jgi:hydroxypyruvate isomerase
MLRLSADLGLLFTELPFFRRFDAAAAAGFSAVELAFPYQYPAAELRSLLTANGLTHVLINAPAGSRSAGERGLACLPDRAREFRDSIEQALDYASAIDCKLVHVMAGILLSGNTYDAALACYAANLAWTAERASAAGAKIVIEPLSQRHTPGYLLRTQEQAAAIIAAVGGDRVGLLFDTYHCQSEQGDIATRLERLMPIISHIQLADVPGRHEPGTGELGWDYIFRQLDELAYRGWLGCEYRPQAETLTGLAWRTRYGLR